MTNQEGNIVAHYMQAFNGGHYHFPGQQPIQQEAEFHVNITLGLREDSFLDLLQFEERYRDLNV